jgi:hypothetical protein
VQADLEALTACVATLCTHHTSLLARLLPAAFACALFDLIANDTVLLRFVPQTYCFYAGREKMRMVANVIFRWVGGGVGHPTQPMHALCALQTVMGWG